jgi:hypothetical protein
MEPRSALLGALLRSAGGDGLGSLFAWGVPHGMTEGNGTIALVEDALTMAVIAMGQLNPLRNQALDLVPVPFIHATEEPEIGGARVTLGPQLASPELDTVLLDLMWRNRPQEGVDEWDRLGLLTEGVRLLGLLLDRPKPPRRIVCYSAALQTSRMLNITFRDPVAVRLGCSVLDLAPTGPVTVGGAEVLFYDGATLTQDHLLEAVTADAPRHTAGGPSPQDFDHVGLVPTAHPSTALLEVEQYRGEPGRGSQFAAGEVLGRWCRYEKRNYPTTIVTKARTAVRNAGRDHLELASWMVARDVLRQAAGYDQLL